MAKTFRLEPDSTKNCAEESRMIQAARREGWMQQLLHIESDEALVLKRHAQNVGHKNTLNSYFPSTQAQNLNKQLEDFRRSEDVVAILDGPKGSGKTTCLSFFNSKAQNCYLWSGAEEISLSKLQSLFRVKVTGEVLPRSLCATQSESAMLFIDDAHLLPLHCLQQVLMFFIQQENSDCKVVLASGLKLSERIDNLLEAANYALKYQLLNLGPITIEETRGYLDYCFADTIAGKHLSKKLVEKIYHLSSGYPGRITRVAQQFCRETEQKEKVGRKKRKFLTLDMLLMTIIISLLLIFGQKIALSLSQYRVSQPGNIYSPPVLSMSTKKHLSPIKSSVGTLNQGSNLSSRSLPQETFEPSYIASIENLPEEMIPQEKSVVKPPSDVATAEKKAAETDVQSLHDALSKESRPESAYAKDHRGILKTFAVQVAASQNLLSLKPLIKRYHLQSARIFKVERNGKSWLILTSGAFRTVLDARDALLKLPPEIQVYHPWVRPITKLTEL